MCIRDRALVDEMHADPELSRPLTATVLQLVDACMNHVDWQKINVPSDLADLKEETSQIDLDIQQDLQIAARIVLQRYAVDTVRGALQDVLTGEGAASERADVTAPSVLEALELLYVNSAIDQRSLAFCSSWLRSMRAATKIGMPTQTLLREVEICATKWYSNAVSHELHRFLCASGLDAKEALQAFATKTSNALQSEVTTTIETEFKAVASINEDYKEILKYMGQLPNPDSDEEGYKKMLGGSVLTDLLNYYQDVQSHMHALRESLLASPTGHAHGKQICEWELQTLRAIYTVCSKPLLMKLGEGDANHLQAFLKVQTQYARITSYERRAGHEYMHKVRALAEVQLPDELGESDAALQDLLASDRNNATSFEGKYADSQAPATPQALHKKTDDEAAPTNLAIMDIPPSDAIGSQPAACQPAVCQPADADVQLSAPVSEDPLDADAQLSSGVSEAPLAADAQLSSPVSEAPLAADAQLSSPVREALSLIHI